MCAAAKNKRQPESQAVYMFWRITQKQPHYGFSISVDQNNIINQVKLCC